MLMTQYTYAIEETGNTGCKITVTRLADNATKSFAMASVNSIARMKSFMNSITDDLAGDYFPKPRKNKK